MDKPKCKVCGKSHWSHEDHVWSKEVVPRLPEKFEGIEITDVDDKPKFDRVAYQREYMRKRRAKMREEKSKP